MVCRHALDRLLENFHHLLERYKLGEQLFAGIGQLLLNSKTGLVHSSTVTAANVHDRQELPKLMHSNETRLYGDSAYTGQKAVMRKRSAKVKDFTNQRSFRNHGLTEAQRQTNRRKSSVRARVEHPFLWIKRIWGFAKVRYRGLSKNANRSFVLLALFNIVKWNRPLTV